jgi:hypothetical protein
MLLTVVESRSVRWRCGTLPSDRYYELSPVTLGTVVGIDNSWQELGVELSHFRGIASRIEVIHN